MDGEFPRGWDARPLDKCVELLIDYRGKTPRKTNCGVPLITARIVKGGRIGAPEEYIAPEDYAHWMRRGLPKAGDIVLTTEAPLGEVAQLDGTKVALAQRLITIRARRGFLDNTFLKFLMQSAFVQKQLHARATGTTVLGIRQSELRKVNLVVPPMDEQRAIARILGALDDRIELNRRMNQTLESMARAIFKRWFVDFDPVRAKAEGRQPAGMNAETAALFPATFVESQIGRIPKGWLPRTLPEAVAINPPRSLARGMEAPYLDMQNMPTTGHRPESWVRRAFGSGMKFVNGDTLVARITPCLENGKTAFVDFLNDGEVGWGSTEYIVLHPLPPLPAEFGYYLARSEDFRTFAIQNMTGTSGRQRVPAQCFRQYVMAVPGGQLGAYFGRIVRPWMRKISANVKQNETLAAVRDSLLPKLLSGEIRIRAAEKIVEART